MEYGSRQGISSCDPKRAGICGFFQLADTTMTELRADADSNRETELKLAVSADTLQRLRSDPAIMARATAPDAAKSLESTYFDTSNRDLAQRKVTLRVRKSGDTYIQTVKGPPDSENPLSRGEWEWPVTGPGPDFSVVTDETPLALLGSAAAGSVAAVFTSHIDRTIRNVKSGEARIEIAFDSGFLRTPAGAVRPVSEIELELKGGEASALYDLAIDMAALAPVRVDPRTKAARGFALANGEVDRSYKAERLKFSAETTVEGALATIVRGCMLHLSVNEACAMTGLDSEGVHQMRVAARRLRSALSLFEPFVPAGFGAWLAGEVKWLGNCLGPARDWDVFLADLLAPLRKGLHRSSGDALLPDLDLLDRAARRQRERAYDCVREALSSPRYTLFQLKTGAWLESRGWRGQPVNEDSVRLLQPVLGLADGLLDRCQRAARKRRRGFAKLPPAERHKVRIAVKKLRYAAENFQSLYDDKPTRRYIQQMAQLQDALGHLNDVANATRMLRELHDDGSEAAPGEARAAGVVLGWHARGVVDSEDALIRRWEDFADAKPFWSSPPRVE